MAAASDPEALAMGKITDLAGDGPCLAAVRELRTIHVQDLGSEKQWPALSLAAAHLGYRSILAVPVELDDQTRAALIFYAEAPVAFTTVDITQAENFAREASKALRRQSPRGPGRSGRRDGAPYRHRHGHWGDYGAKPVLTREGISFLRDASNARNTKLRDVAKHVIVSIDGTADVQAHFEE